MQEVYRDRYLVRDYTIAGKDFTYFSKESRTRPKRAGWKDYTLYKLGQVYKNFG